MLSRLVSVVLGLTLASTALSEGYLSVEPVGVRLQNASGDSALLGGLALSMGAYANPWLSFEGRVMRGLFSNDDASLERAVGVYVRPVYPMAFGELYGMYGFTDVRIEYEGLYEDRTTSVGAGVRVNPANTALDMKIEYLSIGNTSAVTIQSISVGLLARF